MPNDLERKEHRVLIIGGGATGAVVLFHCLSALRELTSPLRERLTLTVIEPKASLGRGRAYSTLDTEHILNVPAEGMSLSANDPLDFLNWLKVRHQECMGLQDWPFVPRAWFGEYLEWKLESFGSGAYRHLRTQAISLQRNSTGWEVVTSDQNKLDADSVVIATGYAEELGCGPLKFEGAVRSQRILQPYDCERLRQIPPSARVMILGTGLTSIDVFRTLHARGVRAITFLSRHGRFPLPHGNATCAPAFAVPELSGCSPLEILRSSRRLLEGRQFEWRSWVNELRPQIQALWASWSDAEQAQFVRHLRRHWEVMRHRMPATVYATLAECRASGQAQVIAGRIENTRVQGDELIVTYQPRGHAGSAERLAFDWVVLAHDVGIRQDLTRELGCSNPAGLWVAGPSAKAALWEITAIPEIRVQAAQIAAEIIAYATA